MDAAEIYHTAPEYRGIKVFTDARLGVKALEAHVAAVYYVHTLPLLPERLDKTYRFYNQTVNPYRLYCGCNERKEKAERLQHPRDIRQICLHLYRVTKKRFAFDPLTELLLENQAAHGEEKFIKREINKSPVILGIKNRNRLVWINVYLKNRFEEGFYTRHAFNREERRWSFGGGPEEKEAVENLIQMLFG